MHLTTINCRFPWFTRKALTKTLLIMRLTAIILLAACLHVTARGISQGITLKERDASLEDVFKAIRNQSGYSFVYTRQMLQKAKPVTLQVKNASLLDVLNECLRDEPLTYALVDNTIVISPKSPAVVSTAPPREIKGTVTDDAHNPLPGVSIVIKGSEKGVSTNGRGEFTIDANPGDVLVFTAVGYAAREIKVGESPLNIVLQPSNKALSEVVVTAFGIQKKESTLGYSISTVSGQDIEQTNTVNPITALQGKVAGAIINVQGTAGVQTSPYIQLRGESVMGIAGTPANNQPIFVIDGNVILPPLVSGDATDYGSQLKDLNPDDYESITVLKGAAATAVYGSRGINGAIVITTKSGHAQRGIGVEYSTTYSLTNDYKPFMQLQNEFGEGFYYREGAFLPNGSQTPWPGNWGPAFDGTMHPAPWNSDTSVPYVAQPNNWKFFYRNGKYLNNNVTLSGAGDKTSYRLSYSNTQDNGSLINNSLNRNALDLKVTGQVNKVFSYELGVNYANTVTYNVYNQSRYAYGGGSNLGFNVYYYPRNTNFAAWHADYRNQTTNLPNVDPIGQAYFGSSPVENAFTIIDKDNFTNSENSFLAYTQIKAQVTPWLDLTAKGNINFWQQFQDTKDQGNGQYNTGGSYALGSQYTTNYEALFMAHASKRFMHDDLTADLRILNDDYGTLRGEQWTATTEGGLQIPNVFILSNSTQNIGENGGYGYTYTPPSQLTIGVAGMLDLSYKDYLNLGITGRNDWLSTLTYPTNVPGANNYSVFYPSVNSSWSFLNEFNKTMPKWLSTGRLRGALSWVGNAGVAGPGQTSLGFTPGTIVGPNGQSITIATPYNYNQAPNLDLKPQVKREVEFGANVGVIKNLVDLDVTWYENNTFNQLMTLPGVQETGYTNLFINAGNIRNAGLEVLLDINPIRTKDWNLDISVNLAHNAGKIIKFYKGIDSIQNTSDYEGAQVWSYVGGAYGQMMTRGNGAVSFLLDKKTGYPIMQTTPNIVGNGTDSMNFANYQYVYNSANLVKVGNVQPTLTGGLLINLRYKDFSLFTQLDGRLGGYTYSESYTYAMGQGSPKTSLLFRDKAHGGVARTDAYTGQTVYDGAVPNGVFAAGQTSPINGANIGGMTFKQAYQAGLVQPWYAPAYYDGGPGYNGTYDWENGINYNGAISKETWLMFREITVAYRVPANFVRITKVFQGARISLSVRNLGYLYNSLPDKQNPASIQSNDPLQPWITGGAPFERNYSATLDLRF